VVKEPGTHVTAEELRTFLSSRVPKWWLAEEFVFLAELLRRALNAAYGPARAGLLLGDRLYDAARGPEDPVPLLHASRLVWKNPPRRPEGSTWIWEAPLPV
jgi:hypothetical protein